MSHDKRTSFELAIVAAGGVITAAFTQVRDGDLHAPWNVVAILPSGSPRRHVCTIATSREARSLLTPHGAEHIDEAFVARGIARLYRRNVDQILGVPDASITIEIGQLEVFVPMVRSDAVACVQIEVENLAVDLAFLAARTDTAIPPLPAPVAWTSAEPLLRSHPTYAAMREFYEHYADIRNRIFAEAPFVATAARRGVNLAAMALFRLPVPPFAGIRVHRRPRCSSQGIEPSLRAWWMSASSIDVSTQGLEPRPKTLAHEGGGKTSAQWSDDGRSSAGFSICGR